MQGRVWQVCLRDVSVRLPNLAQTVMLLGFVEGVGMSVKRIIHLAGRSYINRVNKSEATAQRFRKFNERPIEFRFLFESISDLRPKTVLDVGTGKTALPAMIRTCGCLVTAIDNVRDYWPNGMVNRHWFVLDDDIRRPRTTGPFDMISCISVIEHIEDPRSAFASMIRLLEPGGHLVLTTPYNESRSVPNVYALADAAYGQDLPYICRSTSRTDLDDWLKDTDAQIIRQEYWRLWSGDVWTQGEFLPCPERTGADQPHQLSCLLIGRISR